MDKRDLFYTYIHRVQITFPHVYFWGSGIYGENEVNRQDLLLYTAHLYLFKTPLKKLFKKDYKTIKSYF